MKIDLFGIMTSGNERPTDLSENDQKPAENAAPEEVAGSQGGEEQTSPATPGETVGDPAEASSQPSLEEQLAAARAETQEYYNRYLRAMADLDTYRRRVQREKDELRKSVAGAVIEDLLPVLDNLNLGLQSALQSTEAKGVADGVAMVLEQFRGVLAQNGVVEIAPAPGDAFDPHNHDALSHLSSDEVPAEAVLQLIRTGYSLNGRLIRPASVVVSSGPGSGNGEPTAEDGNRS
ncbi:MAG: nucleotide exchange factor GrpE [Puniceicoccaceae bacterium]|nr:MAG: nucleotide exchange factor GrpE [Puniceicoccaceae bacterium]